MAKVTIKIYGKVKGKGRPKFSRMGNFVKTYTPKETVEYENLVRLSWMQTPETEKLSGNIRATIRAYFKIPKSVSKKKHAEMIDAPYASKPDTDNIAKSILDALNGIAYDDDSQVVELNVYKIYSDDEYAILELEEI